MNPITKGKIKEFPTRIPAGRNVLDYLKECFVKDPLKTLGKGALAVANFVFNSPKNAAVAIRDNFRDNLRTDR